MLKLSVGICPGDEPPCQLVGGPRNWKTEDSAQLVAMNATKQMSPLGRSSGLWLVKPKELVAMVLFLRGVVQSNPLAYKISCITIR